MRGDSAPVVLGLSAACDAGRYPDNVEAARSGGWQAIRYRSPGDITSILSGT